MYSKEQFNWVWKDTSREGILNQFYYDHLEMEKYKNIINELDKLISIKIIREANEEDYHIDINDMVEIKTKLLELKEGKNNE